MMFRENKATGFTLLELLVALSIFSMISVMAYGGLQTVITTKNSTQQASARIAEVQLVMLRISNDLRQAVARKVRDEYGDFLPAMKLNDTAMEWSRAGYRNPARLKRSNIQRIAYKLEEHKLIRLSWPVLDRAQDTEARKTELLSQVTSITWRLLDDKNKWVLEWPLPGVSTVPLPLPKAVEINLELEDYGNIRRLILLAEAV